MTDEWQTVQKVTRRKRPQRRRNRMQEHQTGHTHKPVDPKLLEKAVAAQLRATVDSTDSATQDQIEAILETCLAELRGSRYWERLRQVLDQRISAALGSIVCYGIGNFGTKRPSAPLWQLALAILMREHFGSGESSKHETVDMYYFEPLMTKEESKVLQNLGITIINQNERGKRTIEKDNNDIALFFMPHCPMSLYTNLFHTNWDFLQKVLIFGNSLDNYILHNHITTDLHKQQAMTILETLQPLWKVDQLPIHKKDIEELAAYFEQAFNDSSVTSFVTITNSTSTGWPERPPLDLPVNYDGEGEVL